MHKIVSRIMEIDIPYVAFAFAAGWAAFANPCGAMLLPAYVAQYLGDSELDERTWFQQLWRGLGLGAIVSGGFITVFALLIGLYLLISPGVSGWSIWIGTGLGILLIVFGIVSLRRKELITFHLMQRLAGRVQSLAAGSEDRNLKFYYLYGVSYALASMACTLPIFLAVVGNAFSGGTLNGVVQFGAYAMGMAVLMIALSLAMVFARGWIQKFFPKFIAEMPFFGAVIMIFAGGYLIWYNLILSGIIKY